MLKIVQFTHPGEEHKPDKKNEEHKSWNASKHKRKFMLTEGEYIEGGKKKRDKLMFWGEWEPPSKVRKLKMNGDSLLPQWLHCPYLPNVMPIQKGSGGCSGDTLNQEQSYYQNTDPCVFGKNFIYFNCKQHMKKQKSEDRVSTGLATLEKGSVILFGSTKKKGEDSPFFQLDTVFVVDRFIGYKPK